MKRIKWKPFPADEIYTGILMEFYSELIIMQRWDLSDESRMTCYICLN